MSAKVMDAQGRWRSVTVAFRVSPEEDSQIEALRGDFGFEFWQRIDATHSAVRFCTSWATRPDAVDALLAAL